MLMVLLIVLCIVFLPVLAPVLLFGLLPMALVLFGMGALSRQLQGLNDTLRQTKQERRERAASDSRRRRSVAVRRPGTAGYRSAADEEAE